MLVRNFSVENGGKAERKKKEAKKKETEPPMEIRKQRGFPPRLEKSLAKSARLFHSSHRPHSQDRFTICFGQRSTLERPLFCLKNGEHLTCMPLLPGVGTFDVTFALDGR